MANVNGVEIDLMPTDAMREEAQRYRDWKAEGRDGGTDVAATRAGQILSGEELSPDTAVTMAAWFARHEVDKGGEGFSPGEDGYPSPGRVAWAAWGGDPGQSWADARSERIKAAQDARGLQGARPYPNEHAARLTDPGQYDEIRRAKDEGGPGIDFIYGIKAGEPVEIQAVRFDAARYSAAEARQWLADHDMQPILFEEATGERSATVRPGTGGAVVNVRELTQQPMRRQAMLESVPAEDSRTLEFPFSSEQPVDRWFGREVLSHEPSAVDLSRLNDSAPLLWNHNPDQVLGVIERAWLADGRGRVQVRFARNSFAEEKLRDVRDGILRNVSVGYSIMDAQPTREGGVDGILATSWQPHEVSVVSVPADQTVGIGRSLDGATPLAAPAASSTPEPKTMEPTIDIEAVRAQAAADERSRVAGITALCREHNANDLAQGLIERGASEADAMREVLAQLATRAKQPATPVTPTAAPIAGSADIGLSEREVQSFSFLRAMRAQLMPNDRSVVEAAAFEREVSNATAQRMGMAPKGLLVPNEVLSRALTAGSATSAGDLIFTDARPGSFIELLRKRNVLTSLGVTVLTGLTGPFAIPKQTGAATAYWVGEQGEATESDPTVGQVNMTAKTLSAWTRFSRLLMLQSSIDVETMVRNELATVMALEQARATLYGTGTSSQPLGLKYVTGINTEDFAANQPTYAELVSMETKIAADDADIDTMAYATNATIFGGFKTTEKAAGTAQFVLEPGGTVNSYAAVRSNQVETGDVFFGVWSQVLMGMWGALDLQVNPYSEDKAGNVRVVVHQSCDVAVRYPEAFCRGNNTL